MNIKEKCELRTQCNALKPVVLMGQRGLTEAIHSEIELALNAHELIKIRLSGDDKKERQTIINTILTKHQAELIQTIGHVASIYRPKPELRSP